MNNNNNNNNNKSNNNNVKYQIQFRAQLGGFTDSLTGGLYRDCLFVAFSVKADWLFP